MAVDSQGTVLQTGLIHFEENYVQENMNSLVLGVVMSLKYADDPTDHSAISGPRGNRVEAEVLVFYDGSDTTLPLPNVVIPPRCNSGIDNFYEELPTPTTAMLDGTPINSFTQKLDPEKLNGDWCLVGFVGGRITQPCMLAWWPHPANTSGPATNGDLSDLNNPDSKSSLIQGLRLTRRFSGSKITITQYGSLFIDTSEANSTVSIPYNGKDRVLSDLGGDIQLDLKSSKSLEVNFNPPTVNNTKEPSLSQPNPPLVDNEEREDKLTRLTLDKDFINIIAGQVAYILARKDSDSVYLGGTPEDFEDTPPHKHVVLETHLAKFDQLVGVVNDLITKYNSHTHAGIGVMPVPLEMQVASPSDPDTEQAETVLAK